MKKKMTLCLLTAMLLGLCGCGQAPQPEEATCGHEAYSDLIARLETKDYDGARALIDAMEGSTEPAPSAEIPQAVSGESVTADVEMVELTQQNVKDYFEFVEEIQIGEPSFCTQYVTLKEEYRDRLLSVENVLVNISCLRCEAYGSINLEEEEFRPEYYEPLSREKEYRVLELDNTGSGWITSMTVFSDRGCFPDYAMDVTIETGSGTLVFLAQ